MTKVAPCWTVDFNLRSPFGSSCFPFVLERRPPVCLHSMDTILRLLEGLRRDKIVWLNTYLTGRLRAMPPPAAAAATAQVSAGPAHADIAALAERVGDFNISMDPWEQTGAAPQGWATHLHQTVIPVQGYIQLRPYDTTLPSFGGGPPATAETANETIPTEVAIRVICRTEESRPGGKGRKPGKPKKKGLLASFEDWFGSINMMNILYVWFPASWGPSVVEAIQKRNATCLAKKPIVRDPHIFDRKEAARGSRAREGSKSGTSKLKVSILSWLPMQELIGLPWMMMTSRRSFPSYSKASCKMCFHRGHPLRGKVPNHKNLRCQCSSQGPVLLQNGETYYNPDANSGLR